MTWSLLQRDLIRSFITNFNIEWSQVGNQLRQMHGKFNVGDNTANTQSMLEGASGGIPELSYEKVTD
jgi:hypothetical protein